MIRTVILSIPTVFIAGTEVIELFFEPEKFRYGCAAVITDVMMDIKAVVMIVLNLIVSATVFIIFCKRYREAGDKSWMKKNELYPGNDDKS